MSDKRPLCKVCRGHHWLREPHEGKPSNVMGGNSGPGVTLHKPLSIAVTLPPRCADCDEREAELECLRKEIAILKGQNAARQRAYRERRNGS